MKIKFIISYLLTLVLSTTVISQNNLLKDKTTEEFIFCELVGQTKLLSNKISVEIDYGQGIKYRDQRIRDEETGKVKSFNSMIDALNYMGERGWVFVQAYAISYGNSNVYHYLLKRSKDGIDYIPDTKN